MDRKTIRLTKSTLADQVFEQLKAFIARGEWVPGQKLPSDAELAKLFDVNKLTIRIALQKLAALGLTETRKGDGTYLMEFDIGDLLDNVSDFYVTKDMFDDLCTYRLFLETECAKLALERADDEAIQHLFDLADHSRQITYSDNHFESRIDEIVAVDLAFHEYIIELSGSSLYKMAYRSVRGMLRQYMSHNVENRLRSIYKKKTAPLEMPAREDDLHIQITQALLQRDQEACLRALETMIDYHKEL